MTQDPQPSPPPDPATSAPTPRPPRRRRYSGKHPRRFADKYKELQPHLHQDTVAKVIASGKTPAGSHRPIMVTEILEVLAPRPGLLGVDCTLGYGGHAEALLPRLLPGGHLLGLDADPLQLPRTEARLRALGFDAAVFSAHRTNFAALPAVLARTGFHAADVILVDLGVSSMQLDDPDRGFSLKGDGPLDMRMNPNKGQPVSHLLRSLNPDRLTAVLQENADEPHAGALAASLAGRDLATTRALAEAVRAALPNVGKEDREASVRRVFQALRILVNDEFSALDTLLKRLPDCLKPGGRVAILTFHSGEDRRVKHAFESGLASGLYADIARNVLRPSPSERHDNPRSIPAKLRWASRAAN